MFPPLQAKTCFISLLTLLHTTKFCSAIPNIAKDCGPPDGERYKNVSLALKEAENIADYASKRWSAVSAPKKGNLMQDMQGAPSEDHQETFEYAKGVHHTLSTSRL